MKKRDIGAFIEEMEHIGDIWTPEQVESAYGDFTLEEALTDRKNQLNTFFDITGKAINS